MRTKGLNGNQLKVIAMVAMTIDHLVSVIWPNYPTDWGIHPLQSKEKASVKLIKAIVDMRAIK
ncbi:MAG: hypothetical protein II571_07975, partial [Lachnospiraceae bacterium]|nr:hypothetical protein [Lachnospiraceae bacterium]